ncbi:MAG: excinuclease ABC subunit UvrC [Actinomycetes bacterium]
MLERPPASSIPDAPGSYQFKDRDGRVIYVGKAKSLRSRVGSYFARPDTLHQRTRQMVETAESVEWIEVRNEVEALFLEHNLIKRHHPRFNIDLKDDKSYPYLAITLDEEWPRAMVMRGAKRRGVRYFGPYAHAWAIRETLDALLRTFPIRTCTAAKFQRHARDGRPCLYAHIDQCVAPCVDATTREQYDAMVASLIRFLEGDVDEVVGRLTGEMQAASEALEFERAARLRDQLGSIEHILERQTMVGPREEDLDLLGLVEDPIEASVQVFHVRRGRVVGRKGLIVDKVEDLDTPALVGRLLQQLYAAAPAEDIPREILVPVLPDDPAVLVAALSEVRGARVEIRVPRRGPKRELAATVTRNAEDAFARHRLKRASDHNARARTLTALQEALELPEAPLRIECFDIANLGDTEIVASMTVLEDGMPKRNQYRRFTVRHGRGQDDFASMEEVLTRRFTALLRERDEGPEAGRRFSYPPQLLVIDGGKGQLGVAVRVLEDLGLAEEIPVVGLAKRFEEVYLPGREDPVRIPRDSEALYLLQQVRDEAHRFANTFHRTRRDKRMVTSVLDDVPGLGPARRKRLLKEFGSVKRLREQSRETLTGLGWLPTGVGEALHAALHGEALPGGGTGAGADLPSLAP